MRKKIAAGNWKMNTDFNSGVSLAKEIADTSIPQNVDVILSPPFTHLKTIVDLVAEKRGLHVSAQNCATQEKGAYTGEIAVNMIKSIGVTHVIIGHSERRSHYGEDASVLNAKLKLALESGLTPIYCFGEPLEVRKKNQQESYVQNQLESTVFDLDASDFGKLILAYEPIWAIGTGETASPDQAQEMHAAIRGMIAGKYNDALAQSIPILYGGSVKPANAKDIFAKADVDGGLVGGASLTAENFIPIINSF